MRPISQKAYESIEKAAQSSGDVIQKCLKSKQPDAALLALSKIASKTIVGYVSLVRSDTTRELIRRRLLMPIE